MRSQDWEGREYQPFDHVLLVIAFVVVVGCIVFLALHPPGWGVPVVD